MTAGESAQAEAQRVREKIETLQRYLYAQERGAEGERITAEALRGLGPDWVLLHDVRWPGRLRGNIDHVAVGPGGIFVIDSKNWSGDVRVSNGVLRQNGYSREKNVAGAADAALAIAELAGAAAGLVQPVLCFVGQPAMQGLVREVAMCAPNNIVAVLTNRPRVLSPPQVLELATRLDAQLRSATEPGRGYRPSGYQIPRSQRPVSRPPITTHPPAAFGRPMPASGSHGSRQPMHVAAALLAVIFVVIPLLGAIAASAYTAIADAGTAAPVCSTAVAENQTESAKSVADAQRNRRQTVATKPTEC